MYTNKIITIKHPDRSTTTTVQTGFDRSYLFCIQKLGNCHVAKINIQEAEQLSAIICRKSCKAWT